MPKPSGDATSLSLLERVRSRDQQASIVVGLGMVGDVERHRGGGRGQGRGIEGREWNSRAGRWSTALASRRRRCPPRTRRWRPAARQTTWRGRGGALGGAWSGSAPARRRRRTRHCWDRALRCREAGRSRPTAADRRRFLAPAAVPGAGTGAAVDCARRASSHLGRPPPAARARSQTGHLPVNPRSRSRRQSAARRSACWTGRRPWFARQRLGRPTRGTRPPTRRPG